MFVRRRRNCGSGLLARPPLRPLRRARVRAPSNEKKWRWGRVFQGPSPAGYFIRGIGQSVTVFRKPGPLNGFHRAEPEGVTEGNAKRVAQRMRLASETGRVLVWSRGNDSNNVVERANRPITLARKTSYSPAPPAAAATRWFWPR